jgi:hypothetical protein
MTDLRHKGSCCDVTGCVKMAVRIRWINNIKYRTEISVCYTTANYVNSKAMKKYTGNLYPEKKGKGVPVHAMKAHRGSRGIAPLILNFGTRWR